MVVITDLRIGSSHQSTCFGASSERSEQAAEAFPDSSHSLELRNFVCARHRFTARRGRKGAPDTFNIDGYVALLRRIRSPGRGSAIYSSCFDSQLEESIGSAARRPPRRRWSSAKAISC